MPASRSSSTYILKFGHLTRFAVAFSWLSLLAVYCGWENNKDFFSLATSQDHATAFADTVPECCETFHVEIAEGRPGSNSINWQVYRKMTLPIEPGDPRTNSRPYWSVLTSDVIDQGFFWTRTHSFVTFVSLSPKETINLPAIKTYGRLLSLLILFGAGSLVYGVLMFFYRPLAENSAHAAIIISLLAISAQIWITYLQGGLVVSPLGGVFSTVMAFLVVHAPRAVEAQSNITFKLLHASPSACHAPESRYFFLISCSGWVSK
jgi:hypothetical protein